MWWQAGFGRFLLPWPLVLRLAPACQTPETPRHHTAPRCGKKGAVSWLCFGENLLRRGYFCSGFHWGWCHAQGGRRLPHLVLHILQSHGGKPTRHFWSWCQVRGQNQGIPDFLKRPQAQPEISKHCVFYDYSSILEWKAKPRCLFIPFQKGSLGRQGCKMTAFLLAVAVTTPQQATPCLAAVARVHQDFASSITNTASEGLLPGSLGFSPAGVHLAACCARACCSFSQHQPPQILQLKLDTCSACSNRDCYELFLSSGNGFQFCIT